jgi:hypothetical protein
MGDIAIFDLICVRIDISICILHPLGPVFLITEGHLYCGEIQSISGWWLKMAPSMHIKELWQPGLLSVTSAKALPECPVATKPLCLPLPDSHSPQPQVQDIKDISSATWQIFNLLWKGLKSWKKCTLISETSSF